MTYSPSIAGSAAAWRLRDKRSVSDWAQSNVVVPGSARARAFSLDAGPHLREPLDMFSDPSVRGQVILMPTGAGKTTVFDVCIPYAIAEEPDGILLGMQTDSDAKEHVESRLMPTLRSCEPIKGLMDGMDRHSIRKDAIIFPHMNLFVRGANKTNFQRISVRTVMLDEVWLIKHGLVAEAEARCHNRWNRRVILVSQGGDMHVVLKNEKRDTELHSAWLKTDQREFSMVCPECAEASMWNHKQLIHDPGERADGTIDELEVIQSTRYSCPKCSTLFEDRAETRRMLVDSSIYVATNPAPFVDARGGRYIGHHASAVAMLHESWGDLAVARIMAKRSLGNGDIEPMKTLITKRWAMFWKEDEDAPSMALGASGFVRGDFADGQLWPGETHRFLTIDRQRDHFYAVGRAWASDGTSCLLWEGKLLTRESIRELQQRLKIIDDYTAEDMGYEAGAVYEDCADFGWVAFRGSGDEGFIHRPAGKQAVKKFYSPLYRALAPSGRKARYLFWSNEKVKDILVQKRAGRGPSWLVLDDVSEGYKKEMCSEVKRDVVNKVTKAVTRRYVKTRKDNHRWDCEAMQLVFALIKGLLGGGEVTVTDDGPVAAVVEDETPES